MRSFGLFKLFPVSGAILTGAFFSDSEIYVSILIAMINGVSLCGRAPLIGFANNIDYVGPMCHFNGD